MQRRRKRAVQIVPALQDASPGSTQVVLVGLEQADDRAVWEYAREHGYVIVTKDDDFVWLELLLGYPPKVILLTPIFKMVELLGGSRNGQTSPGRLEP